MLVFVWPSFLFWIHSWVDAKRVPVPDAYITALSMRPFPHFLAPTTRLRHGERRPLLRAPRRRRLTPHHSSTTYATLNIRLRSNYPARSHNLLLLHQLMHIAVQPRRLTSCNSLVSVDSRSRSYDTCGSTSVTPCSWRHPLAIQLDGPRVTSS